MTERNTESRPTKEGEAHRVVLVDPAGHVTRAALAKALGTSHYPRLSTFSMSDNDDGHEEDESLNLTDEDKLSYLNIWNPGFRETYKKEFGREPDPEGLRNLIARETGAGSQTDSERQERLDSPETAD